jgi:steroid delta-isomerase-like uncharacterized protein
MPLCRAVRPLRTRVVRRYDLNHAKEEPVSRSIPSLLIVCLAIAAVAWPPPARVAAQATPAAGDALTTNEALVRRYYEIASSGDLDTLTEVVSPELVIHTAPPGEGSSLETLQATLATVRVGLPDFTFRIDDLFAEGDFVVARTTITGTHLGDFFGAPPTGNRFEVPAIDIWRVEDGTLAANWHLEDILSVMEQIAGIASMEGAATPRAAATPEDRLDGGMTDAAARAANVALAERFHEEIFERGNVDVAKEILAPGFVWHSDVPPGVDGVMSFAADVRAAFPDLSLSVDQVVAEGDRVAILWTLSGTHQGEFLSVPATGNSVSTPGVDIYRIENGQIAEIWTVGDELGLLIQLGSFPEFWADPPGTPAP